MTQAPSDWDLKTFSQKYIFRACFVLAPSTGDTAMNTVPAHVYLIF